MNYILDQYKIQFSTPINYPFFNRISSINETMSFVIGENFSKYGANALLKTVKDVMNDPNLNEISFDSEGSGTTIITKTVTKMYNNRDTYLENGNSFADYSLPTHDFLIIVQAWYDI